MSKVTNIDLQTAYERAKTALPISGKFSRARAGRVLKKSGPPGKRVFHEVTIVIHEFDESDPHNLIAFRVDEDPNFPPKKGLPEESGSGLKPQEKEAPAAKAAKKAPAKKAAKKAPRKS